MNDSTRSNTLPWGRSLAKALAATKELPRSLGRWGHSGGNLEEASRFLHTSSLFGSFHIHVQGRAGTYETVSIDIVDTIDGRPIFIDPESAGRSMVVIQLSFPEIISGRIDGAVQAESEWRVWRQSVAS
jgi:hypothetical protein